MIGFDEQDLPKAFDGLPDRAYMKVGDLQIPRAASWNSQSPLYDASASRWSPKIEIFLDGRQIHEVVSYDVDQGAVRVHRLRDGRPFVEADEVASEILHGKVEIRTRKTEA
jgi:hypothetical protein